MKIIITLPVYNEEKVLEKNVLELYNFCQKNIVDNWQIVIANNASTDKTAIIGQESEKNNPDKIVYIYIPQKGRGGALREAWLNFPADIYIYLDIDLATDLKYLLPLIDSLKSGYDIAIGSRLIEGSNIERSFLREFTSRTFNFLLKFFLNFQIKDSQCGFKGATYEAVQKIMPRVLNNDWFFDTEFLFLAQKNGYKIKEIPIRWIEASNQKRKSKVNVLKTSINYLEEIWRLRKSR